MQTKLHLNTKELTTEWLAQMQDRYAGAQLEIIVHETAAAERMTEAEFWRIISLLDWDKGEDNDAILAPAVQALAEHTTADIQRFQDLLAEKLFQLDKQAFAEQIGQRAYGTDRHFSVDTFLYARACVVANGKAFYESVLRDPSKMPKAYTFEPLLYLASTAYEQKTGSEWDYLPETSYETFSNRNGWGGKSWMDKL